MFPGRHWNKIPQEMNDLHSFGRRGGLEVAYGLKALPCFAFTKTNLSYLQSYLKKKKNHKKLGSFLLAQSLHRASVQVQGLQPGSGTLPGSAAAGAALGTTLQLHQASMGRAGIQIFWIKFGS